MSWLKRRTSSATPNPGAMQQQQPPPVHMYNPNSQHSTQMQGQQAANGWFNQAMPATINQPSVNDYWSQQTYNSQQQQQQYGNHVPQMQQNNCYAQQFEMYNNSQQNAANGMHANTIPPQQSQQQQQQVTGWNSAWGWGEDDTNLNTKPAVVVEQAQVDSFNNELWNWDVDDASTKQSSALQVPQMAAKPENLETVPLQSVPLRQRSKFDPLTPQWSIESQVSQESTSDDVLPTSESDKLFSRSSTISHSPMGSGHETPQEAQPPSEEDHCENKEIPPPPPPMAINANVSGENPYKVGKLKNTQHKRNFYVHSANLETVPDNSEAPDLNAEGANSLMSTMENNEAPPLNERNQYLETGQLSDDNNDMGPLPPPGLSRMVQGAGESNIEPPGFSRMVVGQGQSEEHVASPPPAGLHRMVPGESSSPELPPRIEHDEEASDPELQQLQHCNPLQSRSATIGADTPPAPPPLDNQMDKVVEVEQLTTSVRDLTVGENTSDSRPSAGGRGVDTDSEFDRPASRERRGGGQQSTRPARSQNYRNERAYDDDTDYYSDTERDRRRDDRDRDRVEYGSLRRSDRSDRDKERERRRRAGDERTRNDYRRQHRERDYDYYRYDDDYDRSSRPSSRTDSMQRRDRQRERDREHSRSEREHRKHRDAYNMYKMRGYPMAYDAYNPSYYQQYQRYLDQLRRHDPQAYAEWYRQYYQQNSAAAASSAYAQEEKTSVHSGRSSANDDLAKERYMRFSYSGHSSYHSQTSGYYRETPNLPTPSMNYGSVEDSRSFDYTDNSLRLEETTAPQRYTPAKFSTAHIKASISCGRLVKILPHYPIDGQAPLVEIERVQHLLRNDDELLELEQFPGPLVRGVTHKKTIIEYCNQKIREYSARRDVADGESYVLLWELLVLLIRQNGMVVGADIAELLMKDCSGEQLQRPPSAASSSSGVVELATMEANSTKEEYVTNKFRDYLIYGSGQQALEWAMKNGLWGHALFLASKLDKRTHAKVMMRFANGLPINDPLQTLYQLLSGHLPAATTSVSDEKWGDWRPHLAMILSNTTQRPELDRKAITTLGDTLMTRGSLFASQFCYLMAEVGFSRYGAHDGRMVLLGADSRLPFHQFARSEAVHMTEIYEYACSLNDASFRIPEFQAYKYLVATRLADRGFLESSLAYLEQTAIALVTNPVLARPGLISKVVDLADRLKHYDSIVPDEGQLDCDRVDQSWLHDLKAVQQQYTMGLISHQSVNQLHAVATECDQQSPQTADAWIGWQQSQDMANVQLEQHPVDYSQSTSTAELNAENVQQYQEPTQWQQQTNMWQQSPDASTPYSESQPMQALGESESADYWHNAQVVEDVLQRPQISMPNQSRDADAESTAKASAVKSSASNVTRPASTGWFGGIWSKLALRPKNQMKLPDDKNPTIVWDAAKNRWVNTEEDSIEKVGEMKPPPKMAEMMPNVHQVDGHTIMPSSQVRIVSNNDSAVVHPQVDSKPPLPSQNMFKLQRGRSMKKSYVDVFNPSGTTSAPMSTMDAFHSGSGPASMPNYFVPAPMDANAPTDFLTPGNTDMNQPQQS